MVESLATGGDLWQRAAAPILKGAPILQVWRLGGLDPGVELEAGCPAGLLPAGLRLTRVVQHAILFQAFQTMAHNGTWYRV